jgi:hypothetical protein
MLQIMGWLLNWPTHTCVYVSICSDCFQYYMCVRHTALFTLTLANPTFHGTKS